MDKYNIVKKILESYAINIPIVGDSENRNDKINICRDSIDFIELDEVLSKYYLSEESKKITYDENFEKFIDSIMLKNSKRIKDLRKKINSNIKDDYYVLTDHLILKGKKLPKRNIDKGKIANILFNKLLISDIKRLGLKDIDYNKINEFLKNYDKNTNNEEDYINSIIKKLYNCPYSLLKEYKLNILLYEPSLENDLIEPSNSTMNNIYAFLLNNKDEVFSEEVIKCLNSKIGNHFIKSDIIIDDYYKKYIMFPKEVTEKKYTNEELFFIILNKYILISSMYKNYDTETLDRFFKVQKVMPTVFKVKIIDYITSKENSITEEEKRRIFKESSLFDIMFSNEKLSKGIIEENIDLLNQIFDPNGVFKDINEVELAELIVDNFVIKAKNELIINEKILYKDADEIVKKIIKNRKKI